MDNVVQNINIEDLIPSNFKPTNEEKQKINELAVLIKQFGLLEPILVRPKNDKYEIILGMDKYQAALIANQNIVPVIIKEVDDEKYSNINNDNYSSLKFSQKEQNSDIINLSELSKIKLEYERDDVKMNNGQLNNEMTNSNFAQPNMGGLNQGPTFGGRFFPSLEDEPTNMNMMGGLHPQQPSLAPTMPNNNLIDLTDLSLEKEQNTMPNLGNQPLTPPSIEPTLNNNFNQTQNNFDIPNLGLEPTPMPANDNIINLDSLQNNNPAVKPITEPVSMDILNADFGAPKAPITEPTNQFDMGPINLNTIAPQNQVPSDFGLNQTMMSQQPQMPPVQPMPNFDVVQPVVPNFDMNTPVVPNFEMPTNKFATNPVASKDVTPVTNTIKNLVTSLEAFGYKINVIEEDLPTTSKLTIEVEK